MKLLNATSDGDISAFDDKLPFKLGIILLSATVFAMAIGILLVALRRKKEYTSISVDNDDRCQGEEDELVNFDVDRVKQLTYQSMGSKSQLAPVNCAKTHAAVASAFSIGDEGEELSDHETYTSIKPTFENWDADKKVYCTTEEPQKTDMGETRMPELTISKNPDTSSVRSESMLNSRRFSSTPNIQSACSDLKGTDSQDDNADGPVDETSLFDEKEFGRGLWLDNCQAADACDKESEGDAVTVEAASTSTASSSSSVPVTSGSLGDIGCMRPLLSVRLPSWARVSGRPEYGMLLFTLALRDGRQAGEVEKSHSGSLLLDIGILEAHCVLSRHVEPRAGKFYVKTRLCSQDMDASTGSVSSVASLDQLNPKQHGLLCRLRSSPRSSGRTPVRQAFRSPVFRHIVTVNVPPQLANMTRDDMGGSILIPKSPVVASAAGQNWELRLDLKERRALKTEELFGGHTGISLPSWKSSQLLSSVRIPLGRRIWRHLMENYDELESSLRKSTLVPEGTELGGGSPGTNKQAGWSEQNMLRFVRRLEPQSGVSGMAFQDQGARGQFTFGLQYNNETGRLDTFPIRCFGVIIPKGTHGLFLRASLMSNRKLIDTQQSTLSARLTLNAAEFLLGERVQFSVEESLSQVCLLLCIFCRSGRRFNDANTLIGRCIVGPSGLAYGEGLDHWTDMAGRKVMVKRTHILW